MHIISSPQYGLYFDSGWIVNEYGVPCAFSSLDAAIRARAHPLFEFGEAEVMIFGDDGPVSPDDVVVVDALPVEKGDTLFVPKFIASLLCGGKNSSGINIVVTDFGDKILVAKQHSLTLLDIDAKILLMEYKT